MKIIRRSKKVYLVIGLICLVCSILGLTYSAFMVNSTRRAAEMYIGNLIYGIEIVNEDNTLEGINGRNITLEVGESKVIKVTLTSLNPIDSKYKLLYKVNSGVSEVKYLNTTTNPVSGDIEKETSTNKLEILIYVKNKEDSISEISFGVSGGYKYNNLNQIALLPGYSEITNSIEFGEGDFRLAVFVDGEKTNEFPARNSGYLFEKLECSESGAARWDLENWELMVYKISGPTECNVYFAEGVNFKSILLTQNTLINGNPSFSNISNDGDTGMYSMADNDGTSYYFRGTKNLLNNNVIFAEHQWKIIRINGDGSIRMIYNGDCLENSCTINSTGTNTQIGTSAFNSLDNESKFVGYTYDTNTSSTIKEMVETWYQNNLSSYDTYIADTVYCGDRYATGTASNISYGAFPRLSANPTPSLKCTLAGDKYTKSAAKGNGLLAQKAGLITADETAIAGGVYLIANNTNYLYTAQNYWSFSPARWNGTNAYLFNVTATGVLNNVNATAPYGVRPVISLNSSIQIFDGNGSAAKPYIIKY